MKKLIKLLWRLSLLPLGFVMGIIVIIQLVYWLVVGHMLKIENDWVIETLGIWIEKINIQFPHKA